MKKINHPFGCKPCGVTGKLTAIAEGVALDSEVRAALASGGCKHAQEELQRTSDRLLAEMRRGR